MTRLFSRRQTGVGSRATFEKTIDKLFRLLTLGLAIGISLILVAIFGVIIWRAWPAILEYGLGFILSMSWNPVIGRENYGALPVVYGTIASSFIGIFFAAPLGVGTAIFLSKDFIPTQIRVPLIFLVELLAAIPSVVYGLWGIFILTPLVRPLSEWLYNTLYWVPIFSKPPIGGTGLLASGIILAIMILPIITAIARESLDSLPVDLKQASLGLGATRWQTLFRVLIPAAFPGIAGGIMLALGRAMGETMAVTMIIGNVNKISVSVLEPANTISSLIASQFAEASGMQVSALMYAGLVLLFLTSIVNIFAGFIIDRTRIR